MAGVYMDKQVSGKVKILTGGNGTTLEQFQKMGMKERSAVQAKDPKRYDELSKQAKGAK